MTPVVIADVFSTLGFGCALLLLVRLPPRVLDAPTKVFFGIALTLYFVVGISNTLEHSGVTGYFDRFEDYLEDLFVPFFLFGLYSISSKMDLDRRLRAEEDLRESRERYRSLMENIDLGIAFIDADFTVRMTNAAQGRLFGIQDEEFIGHACFRAFKHRDASCSECPGRLAMTTGRVARIDEEVIRTDGGHVSLRIQAFPVFAADGSPEGFVEVVEDRTEHTRIERERRQVETQLVQSQKVESLLALTGGIAHDFNNLLMGVLGNAELALMKLPPESPVGAYVKRIETSALRASDLTRQMTAYSGATSPEPKPVDLSRLVDETSPLVEAAVAPNSTIRYRLASDPPELWGDMDQLQQVLMSLVTNAAEALGDHPGTITIRTDVTRTDREDLAPSATGTRLPAGTYAVLEVSDTGPGIDPTAIPRLFDPFYSTKFSGRGLGLPAALGIVRAHKGTIRVESTPDAGAHFQILLPVPDGVSSRDFEYREHSAGGRGRRVIVVADDEETVRTVTRMALGEVGFDVLATADSRECLRLLEKQRDRVAALVLDVEMPGLSGEAGLSEVRRIDASVPVILSSGYGEHEAASALGQQGSAGVLQKPYRRGDLIGAVARALRRGSEVPPPDPHDD